MPEAHAIMIMDERYQFIHQQSVMPKIRMLLTIVGILAVLSLLYLTWYKWFSGADHQMSFFEPLKKIVMLDVRNQTPLGLALLAFAEVVFLIPAPMELLFLRGLSHGNPPILTYIVIMVAIIPAHAILYLIGRKCSEYVLHFFDRKKVYALRRWVMRYGPTAIFFCNALPLPGATLSFALGITKYKLTRLLMFLALGIAVKYMVLIVGYELVGHKLFNLF